MKQVSRTTQQGARTTHPCESDLVLSGDDSLDRLVLDGRTIGVLRVRGAQPTSTYAGRSGCGRDAGFSRAGRSCAHANGGGS